ncbi:MAG: hypothetical protein NZO58_13680, partial [Gemmataceae bacterium]|nr:hypothetical protein [Gemmataceae bacterium]
GALGSSIGCGQRQEGKQEAKADPLKGITFDKQKTTPEPPQPPPQPQTPPQGVPFAKGAHPQQGLSQSIRAAGYRPERQNELRTIAMFFTQFHTEFNRNPRTEDEFIQYLQREAPKIAEALREKYYVLNLRARLTSDSAIAYESLTEANCHQTARGDGSVGLVSPEDLQRMLR